MDKLKSLRVPLGPVVPETVAEAGPPKLADELGTPAQSEPVETSASSTRARPTWKTEKPSSAQINQECASSGICLWSGRVTSLQVREYKGRSHCCNFKGARENKSETLQWYTQSQKNKRQRERECSFAVEQVRESLCGSSDRERGQALK